MEVSGPVTPFSKRSGFDLKWPFRLLENKMEKHQPISSQSVNLYGNEIHGPNAALGRQLRIQEWKIFRLYKKVQTLAWVNRRRVEQRILLSELASFLRSNSTMIKMMPQSRGTYDVLEKSRSACQQ